MPGIYDHVVAAPHCDRYGHVEGNDPWHKVADEAIAVNEGETKQTLIGKLGKMN